MSRFGRQEGIVDQEKIKNLNIAVVGQQCIAHYLTFCYTGLGVGNLYLIKEDVPYKDPYGFMYFGERVTDRAASLSKGLKKIYSDLNVVVTDKVDVGGLERILNLDLVIESTNNPKIKRSCLKFAEEKKIPFISLSSNKYKASMYIYDPEKNYKKAEEKEFSMRNYQNQPQGAITSGFISGLALETTIKLCLPQKGDNFNINNPFHYNLLSKTRFDLKDDFEPREDYSNKRILLVGLGALGTFAGLSIALSTVANKGNTIDVMDPDITDEKILNRQMLYSGRLGESKVNVFKEKLKEIVPELNINSYYGSIGMLPNDEEAKRGAKFFDQSFLVNDNNQKKYDVIVGCLDNQPTIGFLGKWALEFGIPFINANSGVVKETHREYALIGIYIPNKTPCIKCQFRIKNDEKETILKREPTQEGLIIGRSTQNQEGPVHCPQIIVEKTPTLLTPNAIGGVIQGSECFNLLSGIENVEFYVVEYNSTENFRIRSTKKRENCSPCDNKCQCHQNLK